MEVNVTKKKMSMDLPKKTKNRTAVWPSNLSSGYISKGKKNQYLGEISAFTCSLQNYSQ